MFKEVSVEMRRGGHGRLGVGRIRFTYPAH